MRVLTRKEMSKRGCEYCLDMAKKRLEAGSKKRVIVCIHDKCPYHELDPYDTFGQYLKYESSNQSLKQTLIRIFDVGRKTD